MRSDLLVRLILSSVFLTLPMIACAGSRRQRQLVTDSSGAVLPGVTVRAVHEATGNASSNGVQTAGEPTDVGRARRVLASHGRTSGLQHHGPRRRSCWWDRPASSTCRCRPLALQETLTVSGEAPLIETTTSTLGGNIDPRQMAELPGGRTQLDQPRAAGAREPDSPCRRFERRLREATAGQEQQRDAGVPFQRRRPAGDVGVRDRRPAAVRARMRLPNFSSSRTGSTRRRAGRRTCRSNVITKSGTNLLSGLFRGQLSRQHVQLAQSRHRAGGTDQQPAVQHGRRRSRAAGQAALLRQLRVRARAENQHLADAVSVLQCQAHRHEQPEDRRRPTGLSALVTDAR